MKFPIGAITNGIHTRSWVSGDMQSLFDRYLGPRWIVELTNQAVWTQISQIPDPELWRTHERRRERLITFARQRQEQKHALGSAACQAFSGKRKRRNEDSHFSGINDRVCTPVWQPINVRPYSFKMSTVSTKFSIIQNVPVQLIFAGKAHPHDYEGKLLIQRISRIASEPRFYHKIVFIENYDICVGRYLVEGVDIWLNNPLRPNEASGTSGMKAAANGVLESQYCGWMVGGGKSPWWRLDN